VTLGAGTVAEAQQRLPTGEPDAFVRDLRHTPVIAGP
jgi:hypothetical protein